MLRIDSSLMRLFFKNVCCCVYFVFDLEKISLFTKLKSKFILNLIYICYMVIVGATHGIVTGEI